MKCQMLLLCTPYFSSTCTCTNTNKLLDETGPRQEEMGPCRSSRTESNGTVETTTGVVVGMILIRGGWDDSDSDRIMYPNE